jgi:predicted DNA-binding WGR domain protein
METDLLGDFVLFRRWYGLGSRRGGVKRQVFQNREDAVKEFRRIEKLRARHGYFVVRSTTGW